MVFEWKKKPVWSGEQQFIRQVNDDTILGNNVDAKFFYRYLKDELNSENKSIEKIVQKDLYQKYDFRIISSIDSAKFIKEKAIESLKEEELIYVIGIDD